MWFACALLTALATPASSLVLPVPLAATPVPLAAAPFTAAPPLTAVPSLPALCGLAPARLAKVLASTSLSRRADEGRRARTVWTALRKGYDPLLDDEAGVTLRTSAMLRELFGERDLRRPTIAKVSRTPTAIKLLIDLHDGRSVETVLLKSKAASSVCVSSQVGCKQACRFCATGAMGEIRSLAAHEIVEQVRLASEVARLEGWVDIKNIVFMGMGEPLNNVAQVRLAIDLLTDAEALGFSRRAVTISTVAPSSEAVLDMASLSSKMAFSLHSAVDETRKLLVPTMRCTVADLQTAWLSALASRPERYRELIVEMTLINGVNDTPSELAALATWLQVFPAGAILVNLIPMNASPAAPPNWRASSLENARAFQRGLWTHSIRSTIRDQKGDREQAACGQLATNDSRRSASLRP
mmetsp:Transcript_2939/g.10540  ORF Transcript_2939/g.10540 Transcript_2939/m.10540 type:complete len:412 (-) Transcript_2939:35-1270(-)